MIEQFQKYQFFVSPDGKEALIKEIRKFKARYGDEYLEAFKNEFPDFVIFVDLIANHTAEVAFEKLCEIAAEEAERQVQNVLLKIAARETVQMMLKQHQPQLFQLHADLRAEIDKPRF